MGIEGLSAGQVSEINKEIDEQVRAISNEALGEDLARDLGGFLISWQAALSSLWRLHYEGLLDHLDQGLLGSFPLCDKERNIAAPAQLRDQQVHCAEPRIKAPPRVPEKCVFLSAQCFPLGAPALDSDSKPSSGLTTAAGIRFQVDMRSWK